MHNIRTKITRLEINKKLDVYHILSEVSYQESIPPRNQNGISSCSSCDSCISYSDCSSCSIFLFVPLLRLSVTN